MKLSTLAGWIGALGLLASSALPWFTVPEPAAPSGGWTGVHYLARTSRFQLPYQILAVMLGVACLALLITRGRRRLAVTWIGCAALLAGLWFPYFVMIRDPGVAMRATSLSEEAEAATKDLRFSFPHQMVAWKRDVPPLGTLGRDMITYQFRFTGIDFLSLANADRLFFGFGFSNEFLQFMKRGYPAAVASALLLALSGYLDRDRPRRRLLRRQIVVVGAAGLLSGALGLAPVLRANYLLHLGESNAAQGLYDRALRAYADAERWEPALRYDTLHQHQVGQIDYLLRRLDRPGYYLFLGDQHFDSGAYSEAISAYREALRIAPGHPVVSHVLSAALTNLGTAQYAEGLYHQARSSWTMAMEADPLNVVALFDLQIATFQAGDYGAVNTLATRFLDLLNFYQLPPLSAIGQTYVHLSWSAYMSGQYAEAFDAYRKATDPVLW